MVCVPAILQVRKVICEWLAWILRMSRPGRSLSRRYLQRKARMRELTAKSPPSMSLISNVKDVDNAIPLNNYRSVAEPEEEPPVPPGREGRGGARVCQGPHVRLYVCIMLTVYENSLLFCLEY